MLVCFHDEVSFLVLESKHTSTLGQERQDITSHKDLGQPIRSNHGQVTRLEQGDQAAENHVDGRREESRAQQEKNRLDDVRVLSEVGCLAV